MTQDVEPNKSNEDIILKSFGDEDESINDAQNTTVDNQVNGRSTKPTEADMKDFYERFLPFKYVFQWLSHSPKATKDFTMREFAYEYRTGAYQRYNSFSSVEEFKTSVVNANPTRFEIGAVYSVNPKERRNLPKQALKPLSKELVFDIDLTDYDDIRTCCQGTDICTKCWKFVQVAAKLVETALREDFGFKHMIWVFSGRRGAHCWVSDERARNLDEASRKAVIEYLDVLSTRQSKFGKKSLNLKKPFHPHVERTFNILKSEFINIILEDQEPWLTTPDMKSDSKAWQQTEELLSFVPEKALQNELRTRWKNKSTLSNSKSKWDDINLLAKSVLKSQAQVNQLNEAKKEIIIYYMYPRLDVEVSRQVIHLLKSPFCIHPGTGNVCVPFDPSRNLSSNKDDDAYGFNPTTAPNLRQLQREMEIWDSKHINRESSQPIDDSGDEGDRRLLDYEKTSLKPYVDYFAKYVNGLIKDELKGISSKRDNEGNSLDF
ncbi:uncharacterized protein RJT20DRAFT_127755 [Scheffersomyces xylosifermentans]|uniref:uncharacterized protein n=1 Tax=Scheffersomyces xylosifermentans TaxID=1304137 RepID=UPI00315D0369